MSNKKKTGNVATKKTKKFETFTLFIETSTLKRKTCLLIEGCSRSV